MVATENVIAGNIRRCWIEYVVKYIHLHKEGNICMCSGYRDLFKSYFQIYEGSWTTSLTIREYLLFDISYTNVNRKFNRDFDTHIRE
jgi:hypothetical protein